MAATVKRAGIRKRSFPQSSTKHALSTPYHLQWPTLKKGGNKMIIDEIVRTLEPFHFEQLCTSKKKFLKTTSAEYNKEARVLRIQQVKKEKAEKAKLRSSLVIGLNQVTKALEKGTLKLVLVDRAIKPATLLEHLLVLCATRKAPAYAITGMGESAISRSLGVNKVSAFAFKNIDTPTVFDDMVDFITIMIEPLYVPWLHSRKEESETPTATNPGSYAADDSDEEHLPGIQEMRKRRRFRSKRRKNSQGREELSAVSLQGASDSTLNLPSTSNPAIDVPDTIDSAVNLPSTSNPAVIYVSDTSDSDENLGSTSKYAASVPGTSDADVILPNTSNHAVIYVSDASDSDVNLGSTSKAAASVPGTSDADVNLASTSNYAGNLLGTSGNTVNIPGTGDFTGNEQGSGNSAVNLAAVQAQATGSNTVNSQATGEAILIKGALPSPASAHYYIKQRVNRKRRRSSRNTKRKNENNDDLVYLRPCVKSFDTEKDKGKQKK